MRIYIAIPNFLPLVGGSERQALAHSRSLRERGFVTTIVTLRHDRNWLAREVIEGVPTLRVAGTLLGGREKLPRPLQKLLYLLSVLVLSWTLWRHRHRYDILHLFHLGLEALPVALVCRLTGKPMVVSVRCADSGTRANTPGKDFPPTSALDASAPGLQISEQDRLEGDLVKLESLGRPVVQFARSQLECAHAVVVIISSRMKHYLAEHDFNLPAIQLIPNGVDTGRFQPIDRDTSSSTSLSQEDERSQVVVCVSKMRYQKGIDMLLRAWRLVHEQAPGARLILVGDGPLQHQLERMAESLGINESVEFAGLQNDVAAQFHRGSLAVLPSYWEGMPNALLEAMACGLSCVATRVSGSEDIIQHGINGLLVEPGDHQDTARALLTLLRDPALARQYGCAARASIERYYSLEHITDRYVELYQSIAGGRSEVTQPSEIFHLQS